MWGGDPAAKRRRLESADGSVPGFKTKMCRFFQIGQCQKGEACTFAHTEEELQGEGGVSGSKGGTVRWTPGGGKGGKSGGGKGGGGYKTKMCNFFMMGTCTKGAACTYAHGEHELQGDGAMAMMEMMGMMDGGMAAMMGGGEGMAAMMGGGEGGGGGRFKTALCKFFPMGMCQKGEACTYAHGEWELQGGGMGGGMMAGMAAAAMMGGAVDSSYKTKPCKYFMMGTCTKGEACTYAHSPMECMGGKGGACSSGKGAAKGMGKGKMMAPMMAIGGCGPWGAGGKGGGGGGPAPYKTKMCNFHLQGKCTKGASCTFAHDESELTSGGGGGGGKSGGKSKGKGKASGKIQLPTKLLENAALMSG